MPEPKIFCQEKRLAYPDNLIVNGSRQNNMPHARYPAMLERPKLYMSSQYVTILPQRTLQRKFVLE